MIRKLSQLIGKKRVRPVDLSMRQQGGREAGLNVAQWTVLIVIFILLGSTLYFQQKYNEARSIKVNPQATADETGRLIAEVDSIYELPRGEEPVIATVNNTEPLKNQPFFSHALRGDKVLIYCTSGRTILYRPGTKKLIDSTSSALPGVCPTNK